MFLCPRPPSNTSLTPLTLCPPVPPPPPHIHTQVRVDHRNGTLHFGAQQLESDKIRGHITLLARRLAKAATMISPGELPPSLTAQRDAALALCREHVSKEHSRLLARKQVCFSVRRGGAVCGVLRVCLVGTEGGGGGGGRGDMGTAKGGQQTT